MKKISIFLPLLMLTACITEDAPELESPVEDYEDAKIVVFGGSTASGSTRADEFPEPSELGICNADKIRILAFKGTSIGGVGGDISAVNMKSEKIQDIDLSKNLNYRDKWTSYSQALTIDGNLRNWFAFPSIAYNYNDISKFTISDNTNYKDLKLNLQSSTYTPELFFGRLKPNGYTSVDTHEAEDITYKYISNFLGTPESDEPQLTGKLYRIVSQLNVNISEVSPNVEKIEMYLSNVPTEIGLYAMHRTELGKEGTDRGYFYPIVEASGDGQHSMNETLVCTVTNKDYEEGTVKLSTFILPSDKGRTVTLKAYIKTVADEEKKEETTVDNEDKTEDTTDENSKQKFKTIERSRLLRASENHYLDEASSKVYFSSTPLPVYKAASNEFMSYPNVRVNVSGKLSDIFSEESESNIVIEICPNYDGEHKIDIE